MSDRLRSLLKSADPAGGDPGLSRPEAARIRRAMLEAAGRATPARAWLPLAAGAALAVLVAALTLVTDLPLERDPRSVGPARPVDANLAARDLTGAASSAEPARKPPRRIDFVTKGGTRVIWTLDPDFDV